MLSTTSITSTSVFTRACHSNLMEKTLSFARLPGGEVYGENPKWFLTGSPIAGYNGVVHAAFPPEGVDIGIDIALEPFQQRGLPFTWWTGPYSTPNSLGTHLQAHGFKHNRDMIGMACMIEELHPTHDGLPELEVEPVEDAETLVAWQPLYSQGFNTPPVIACRSLEILSTLAFQEDLLQPGTQWRHFMVRQQGKIIAISSLFIHDSVAGLYNLVTDPAARSKGIGASMTLQTFAYAKAMGCEIATLQTTYPNALRLYHRLGFEVFCKFGIYQKTTF